MLTISVCIGSSCHLKGSYDVVKQLENLIKQNNVVSQVTIKACFCAGQCTKAVSVIVNDGPVISVSRENVIGFFNQYVLKNI